MGVGQVTSQYRHNNAPLHDNRVSTDSRPLPVNTSPPQRETVQAKSRIVRFRECKVWPGARKRKHPLVEVSLVITRVFGCNFYVSGLVQKGPSRSSYSLRSLFLALPLFPSLSSCELVIHPPNESGWVGIWRLLYQSLCQFRLSFPSSISLCCFFFLCCCHPSLCVSVVDRKALLWLHEATVTYCKYIPALTR